jgi:hypothetical protein
MRFRKITDSALSWPSTCSRSNSIEVPGTVARHILSLAISSNDISQVWIRPSSSFRETSDDNRQFTEKTLMVTVAYVMSGALKGGRLRSVTRANQARRP